MMKNHPKKLLTTTGKVWNRKQEERRTTSSRLIWPWFLKIQGTLPLMMKQWLGNNIQIGYLERLPVSLHRMASWSAKALRFLKIIQQLGRGASTRKIFNNKRKLTIGLWLQMVLWFRRTQYIFERTLKPWVGMNTPGNLIPLTSHPSLLQMAKPYQKIDITDVKIQSPCHGTNTPNLCKPVRSLMVRQKSIKTWLMMLSRIWRNSWVGIQLHKKLKTSSATWKKMIFK